MAESQSHVADARPGVQRMVQEAMDQRASDVHLEPTRAGVEVRFRVDGQLERVRTLERAVGASYVNCMMVLAQMLTYRRDVPQEARFGFELDAGQAVDLRLSVMPTTHGLRAVVRLPAELVQPRGLEELNLPSGAAALLEGFVEVDGGMLVVCGPAGSGKTTTIYALLERIVQQSGGLSVISLEDPVERDVEGITQIEVTPFGELTYEKALRSILRQDPQVLALGEIRDKATASIAVQAALSGHRLIATLHAGTPETALVRLLEMGLEPYQIGSAMHAVLAMRLLRRGSASAGYHGRVPVAEAMRMDEPTRQALLVQGDRQALRKAIEAQPGFASFERVTQELIEAGVSDAAERDRVLGRSRQ